MEFGFYPHIFNPPLSFQVPCDHVHIMSHLSFCWTLFFSSLHATHSKISSPSAKRCRLTKRKALAMRTCRGVDTNNDKTVVGGSVQHISHRIHVWNINRTHIWLIFLFMVNVDISSMHGSGGSAKTSYELSICLHHPQVSTPGSCPLKSMLFSMHPVFST